MRRPFAAETSESTVVGACGTSVARVLVALACCGAWLASLTIGASVVCGAEEKNAVERPADFVLLDGRVATLDARGTIARALAVRDEKLVYVGDDEGAKRFVGPMTTVYRAGGRLVIPGINETHVHAVGVAQGEVQQPFRQLRSIFEIQEWVRAEKERTPARQWIRLPRVDITRVKERRMPNRAELDEAAGPVPAIYVWAYANRQIQVLNSAALAAAGITRDTPAPAKGKIVVDAQGEPTGVIEDAPSLTAKFLPRIDVPRENLLDSLVDVLSRYNRLGITSITERGSNVEGWKTYQELRAQKRLTARTTLTIRIGGDGTVAGAERAIGALPFRFGDGDDWVKVGPLKIGVDGGVLYGTAYLREPYGSAAYELYGLNDPTYRGLLQLNAEHVRNTILAGHRLGWQMSCHVTGDAGVDMVLDAVEAAHADRPIDERRFTLIHAYFPHVDTARRAARMGVCVDTQPAWFYKDADALAGALGPERIERFIGLNLWRDAGVKVALNSDHMQGVDPDLSLNPFNPFLTMYAAITRKTESGRVIGESQRVTREAALRMMTSEAGWLHFDEGKKGRLEVGQLGDLAVLSADFFSCPEEDIKKLTSVLTVVGGRIVHRE